MNYIISSKARLSGTDPDDEELEEVEELERLTSLKDQSLWTKLKKVVLDLVERVGFFGILVCASVSKFLLTSTCCLVAACKLINLCDGNLPSIHTAFSKILGIFSNHSGNDDENTA